VIPVKVTVRFFARFGELLGNNREIEAREGISVADLVKEAASGNKAGYDTIFDEEGAFRDFVIVMRNKKRIRTQDAGSIQVGEGDEIAVFPPVAGG
jgi:molybdopterin synthase sulfur carrier subunit